MSPRLIVALLALSSSIAHAQSTPSLEQYLEWVRSSAEDDLANCGFEVGLPAPGPSIEVGLRWTGGRMQVDIRGLEGVPRAKRAPLARCFRAVVLRVAGSKAVLAPRPVSMKTLPPPPGPPSPFNPGDPHSCRSNAECTIICEDADNCCAGLCGCSHAVNTNHVASVKAARAAACKNEGRCEAVGCAHQEYSAVCENNRCKAVRGGLPF